jgi:hypothetical protein
MMEYEKREPFDAYEQATRFGLARRKEAIVQKELFDAYEQATRYWLDRAKSEMALWADLGPTLASTRSIPEAFDAYGKCASQQMKMTVEDAQHLLNDTQQMSQKILNNGWWLTGSSH